MRVLVFGGRNFCDELYLFEALDKLSKKVTIECVIHGCARGADSLAGEWARHRGFPEVRFPADWDKHGRAAGPIRNQQMIDEGRPTLAIAFPGGRGTDDMAERCKKAGIKLVEL